MRITVLFLTILLGACAMTPKTAMVADNGGTCANNALGTYVGHRKSSTLGSELLKASGARHVRWVKKGEMVTMENRGDRLTVHLDAASRVESLACG